MGEGGVKFFRILKGVTNLEGGAFAGGRYSVTCHWNEGLKYL